MSPTENDSAGDEDRGQQEEQAEEEQAEEETTPEERAKVPDGTEGWEDLMDGKIRRRTVKKGKGEPPEVDRDVVCSFDIRTHDSDVLQKRSRVRYRIGESEAVPALELCLRHMLVGEEAEVSSIHRFAFGPSGCPAVSPDEKEVPSDADVLMRVTLHEVLPPTPTDRSKQDWTQRVQELEWRKTNGNDNFKRKRLTTAAKCYEKGMEVFPEVPIIAPAKLGRSADSAAAAATKLVADVASNLSAVYLEEDKVRDALDHAKIAIDLCPDHPKGLYRCAKCAMQLGEFKECEEFLEKLKTIDADDAGVKRLAAELERAKSKHGKRSKKLGAALLEAAGDRKEYDVKPKEEDEPPPTLKELVLESMPNRWTVLLVSALVVAVGAAIVTAPKDYKPYVIIGGILSSIMIVAIYAALTAPEDDPEEAAEKAEKMKKQENARKRREHMQEKWKDFEKDKNA
eukprot:TRINITY_DN76229_c0_g1_i1.p1 TRINITY_DN76229_c0_g1~~TRINITY_DN76229_c0_g1_i1.p1  ORF type:complete len:472 (-),score=144.03 TRINITY_DN76229_c0_g1_i1:135-1499(-)